DNLNCCMTCFSLFVLKITGRHRNTLKYIKGCLLAVLTYILYLKEVFFPLSSPPPSPFGF
ncbi:mCG1030858, partial [Mus musculus]